MNLNTPTAETLYGNASAMNVIAGEQTFQFVFPDVDNTREHLEKIITGQDYPPLGIEGYKIKTVVDVGANVGAFAFYMAANFPDITCFSFEPSQGAFPYLEQNANQFPGRVHAYKAGLYSEDAEMELYEGTSQSLQNSLYPSSETSADAYTVKLRHAGEVLDELGVGAISILKIDTEGAELPILHALSNRVNAIEQIYVEYHSEQDRRDIDALLAPTHVLARASAHLVHRGTNYYLRADFLERYPELDTFRISRA